MSRPPIPEELKRAVLVEAGHKCAIPRCGQTELDIHHIIPWDTCQKHEFENLIALCPVCHRRAHQGDIDRKALRLYKAKLIADFGQINSDQFSAQIIEIKRRISETDTRAPGLIFNFDFPDFKEPAQRIVSRNLEAWGNELLLQFRGLQDNYRPEHKEATAPPPNCLQGQYKIIRHDSKVISIKYSLDQYFSGAVHGSRLTRVQNFLLKPFQPVTLTDLLIDDKDSLNILSGMVRERLLTDERRDREWVVHGTEPRQENFALFNLEEAGVKFTFSEYQIDCYAAGEQELFIGYLDMKKIMNPSLYSAIGI